MAAAMNRSAEDTTVTALYNLFFTFCRKVDEMMHLITFEESSRIQFTYFCHSCSKFRISVLEPEQDCALNLGSELQKLNAK